MGYTDPVVNADRSVDIAFGQPAWRNARAPGVTLVAAGLGVAIVPAPTAALDIAGVSYRPLQPRTLAVELVAAWVESVENPIIPTVLSVLGNLAQTNTGQG